MTQNAYRVCTAVEGKQQAVIVDFADRHHKRLLEHSEQRMATYYGEPTFRVSVLHDWALLPDWLTAGMPPTIDFFQNCVPPSAGPWRQAG